MKVITDPKRVDEVLERGTSEIIIRQDLRKEMLSGRQLKIYLGTDVTGKDLHLGHAVIHRKLRDFQELGHKVTLLIGDFTTLVGDHSDKLDQRIETNTKEIEQNVKTYKDQFGKTVDLSLVDIVYNSAWLRKLDFNDVIGLAKIFTLQQMIERDAFQKRLADKKPIGLDEILYPLMQGYDAFALKTDIQIGGTDQTFNMQAGRKVMEYFKMKPQNIVTVPLLTGNDGRKMGKSLENYISINSSAKEKYFSLMTIVDDIIIDYFKLLTRIPLSKINEMSYALKLNSVNPMDLKMELAFEITKFFHSDKEATQAKQEFKSVVQDKELPKDIREVKASGKLTIIDALIKFGLVQSKAEAKRLIEQDGVEVNGNKVTDQLHKIELKNGTVIKAGKRGFVKIA